MINFFIPGEPQTKGRPRFNPRTGRARTPEKTRAYEYTVQQIYLDKYGSTFYEVDPLKLYIEVFFKKPKNPKYNYPSKKDLDNVIKIILDGLNGVAFKDDIQIVEIVAKKEFGINEGVNVKIEKLK